MEKPITWTDCVEIVLSQYGNNEPMHIKDIVEKILSSGLYNPIPENIRGNEDNVSTCSQLVFLEIDTKGEYNRFVYTAPATFNLRKCYNAEELAILDSSMNSKRAPLKRAKETTQETTKRTKEPNQQKNRKKSNYTISGFNVVRWKP